jgi:hypothetical protein
MNEPKPQSEHVYWLDQPGNVKKVIRIFFICCGVLALLDLIFLFHLQHKHVYFPKFENFPGFFCLYGFGACVLLVLAARQLRKLLMRPEDYYEKTKNQEPGTKNL